MIASLPDLKDQLKKRQIRRDPNQIAEACIKDDRGVLLKQAEIQISWHRHIAECTELGYYAGILAPWGSGKSTQISIVRPIFEIGKDQNTQIKNVSNTDSNAVKAVALIRNIIDYDPKFRGVFGDLIRKPDKKLDQQEGEWSKHRLFIARDSGSKDPTLEAYGVTSSVTGARARLLNFDDPIDYRNTIQFPKLKQVVAEKIENDFLSRLYPEHQITWIATRWTEDDYTGVLLKHPLWRFLVQSITADFKAVLCCIFEKGKIVKKWKIPLYNEWTEEVLRRRFLAMGEAAFNRGYRQIPYSAANLTFPHFTDCIDYNLRVKDIILMIKGNPRGWRILGALDPSSKRRPGNVVTVVAIGPDGTRWLVASKVGAWSAPQRLDIIAKMDRLWKPDIWIIENNAMQEDIIDTCRDEQNRDRYPFWQKVKGFHTGSNKTDPVHGVQSLDVEFENLAWRIPGGEVASHEATCECGFCRFINEFKQHPYYEHKDAVMTGWFIRERARAGGKGKAVSTFKRQGSIYDDQGREPITLGRYGR